MTRDYIYSQEEGLVRSFICTCTYQPLVYTYQPYSPVPSLYSCITVCCTDTVVEYATLPDPPPLQLVSILIAIHIQSINLISIHIHIVIHACSTVQEPRG